MRKPICERWVEEADARKVRERTALIDGERETRAAMLSAWSMALWLLASNLRSMLFGRG